jgi:protein-tyrosine kinase
MSKIMKALEKAEQAERRADRNLGDSDKAGEDSFWLAGDFEAGAPQPVPDHHHAPPARKGQGDHGGQRVAVAVRYEKTSVEEVCFQHMEERRLLGIHASQALKDAFNVVRTRLLQQTRPGKLNTVMVTSPGPGEGKTTVATNLAITISRDASQTALLVDANLRRPGISCGLKEHDRPGLIDHLSQGVPLPRLLVNPGMEKLVVLPAGGSQGNSADILGSPAMQDLVAEMKTRYPDRYVIFDCPHLLGIPDALVFAEYVDGIVLVVDEGKTTRDDLKIALEMLADRNLLGIVLNNTSNA